jgi:hypothetical protein
MQLNSDQIKELLKSLEEESVKAYDYFIIK